MTDVASAFEGTYGTMYYVADMAKATTYYKEIFGLKPQIESPEWTEFNFGGHSFCLHATENGKPSNGAGILITKVRGINEVYQTLKSRGVEFVNEPHQVGEGGGWSVDFKDPSGNLVSLYEYKN